MITHAAIRLDSDAQLLESSLDIHTLLKQGTRGLHTELDHHPLVKPLLSTTSTSAEIAHSLRGFFHAYATLEQSGIAAEWRDLNLGYSEHSLSDLLRADMMALSGEPLPASSLRPPLHFQHETELLGSLYVVLGSAMGATRIASILAQNPHASVRAVRFFQQLAQSAVCFRALMAELKQRVLTPQQADDILHAAQNTFTLFIHSFDRVLDDNGAIDSHGQH